MSTIKILGKIRQNTRKENQTSKYLLYAIGEIILVVIGILIAENLSPTLKGRFSKIELLKKMY